MTLQELLRTKTDIGDLAAFKARIKMSRQQAWALWHGKDTLGLRVAKRIADATGLSLNELAEVAEAVPASLRAKTSEKPSPSPDAS